MALVSEWLRIEAYLSAMPQCDECDVVLLVPPAELAEQGRSSPWAAAGFDVGYFHSEWSHFSVILNEVIFGVSPQMRSFAAGLNEHLLLESLESVRELIEQRARLGALGVDIEQGEVEAIGIMIRRGGRPTSEIAVSA